MVAFDPGIAYAVGGGGTYGRGGDTRGGGEGTCGGRGGRSVKE